MRRLSIISVVAGVFLSQSLCALPYFRNIGVKEGLPHPNVLSICQDSLGRIWFGTENGACFFDGTITTVLAEGEINQLLCDSEGTVWILREESLYRYAPSNGGCSLAQGGLVNTIYLRDGLLHLICGKEERYLNKDRQIPVLYRLLPQKDIRCIFQDHLGRTWFTCPQGLFMSSTSGPDSEFVQLSAIGDLLKIYESSDGTVWVGSRQSGIIRFSPEGQVQRFTNDGGRNGPLPSNDVRSFVEDFSGNIWIGTYKGLLQYNPQSRAFSTYTREFREGGLGSSSIYALLTDRDGTLWAGTYYDGVNYMDARAGALAFYPENINGGLSHPVVGPLEQAGENGIWIGTEGGGLNLLQGSRIISFHGQPVTNVKSMVQDPSEDCLYIATNQQGLYSLDIRRKKFRKITPSSQSSPLFIINVVVQEGRELFLSTDDGIYVHSLDHNSDSLLYPRNGDIRFVHEIVKDGQLWLASAQVTVFDIGTKQIVAQYPILDGETPVRPMRLLAASDGNVFASTFGHGLYKLQEGVFVPFSNEEQLLSTYGYRLVEAPDGQLLVSGEKGIQLLDSLGNHVRSWLPGQHLPLETLTRDSGLLLTKDGTVYAGGTNGLVSFGLDQAYGPDGKDVYFSLLSVDGVPTDIPSSGKLVLKGTQHLISLQFSSHRHLSEFNWNNYQYRLKGRDKAWKNTDGFSIHAEQIPAGTYCFELRQLNRPEVICSLPVVIQAKWYTSSVAYALYVLLSVFILWMLYRLFRLKEETRRIREINETKLRFFTTVSHELRSPLTLIIAQIESIFRTFHLPPQVTNKMSKVMSQAEQMNQLVTELIDFRKFEQGLVTLHLSPTYVNAFVGDIFDKFREIAAGKDITLEMQPNDGNPCVYMDTFQMQKVMMNLIFNAVKYTPQGGKITLSIDSDREQVHIHVRDTGIGIASEEQDRVFERFYQSEQPDSVTQGIPGSGIGLALAKDIAKKHHGSITLRSKKGEGSDFILSLPLGTDAFSSDKQVSLEDVPAAASVPDDRPCIVIADDNPQMREILIELFQIQYRVLPAADGAEALELVRQNKPVLVVSDVMMPRMNGTELCTAIKNSEELQGIPVVLLTAVDQTEQKIGSFLKGADDYIAKPFNSRLLLARCNNLVRAHKRKGPAATDDLSDLSLDATSFEDKLFLDKIAAFVEENIGNPELSNDMLSAHMNMSRSSFYSRFRRVTLETPNDYITSCRLKKAALMLRQEPNKSIADIAEELGFNTQNYFCRRFKARYGVSPSQYRKM